MKIRPVGATWTNRHDEATDAFCNVWNESYGMEA